MSQASNKVKNRIRSIESTKKITNAMKLIASVKLSKLDKILKRQDSYYKSIVDIFNDAVSLSNFNELDKENIPSLKEYKLSKKRLLILVSSNLGLCGSYNYNIIKKLDEFYKENDEFILIGTHALNELKKINNIKIYNEFINFNNDFDISKAEILTEFILEKYESGEYNSIHLIYTDYINSLVFLPKTLQILPIITENKMNLSYKFEPIFESNKVEVINEVSNIYIKTSLYYFIFKSIVSEQSSRRNAMDNADKNADELIEKLKLEFNKARQAAITQELTEVISGSNIAK